MDQFDFQHNGLNFRCIVNYDNDYGMPWDEQDGHGIIREARSVYGRPDKKPGERILHVDGCDYWIYDFQETLKIAKNEGWGSNKETPEMTKNQKAEAAVISDMEYCRDFLTGRRYWVFIEVYRINDNGQQIGESEFLGGIDSGYSHEDDEYLKECAGELADGIYRQTLKEWRESLHEARERKYWATRDVATVGP